MTEKIDLRIVRTKKMIIKAFMTLSQQKEFDAITIQEIADEAMINRGTFYAHFKDKHDLADQLLDSIIATLFDILDTEQLLMNNTVKIKKLERTLTFILENIQQSKRFISLYTEGSYSVALKKRLIQFLEEKYFNTFKELRITENDVDVPISFITEYMTSIFLISVNWWITTDSNFPPKDMARLLIKLVGNGHLTVLGIEIDRN